MIEPHSGILKTAFFFMLHEQNGIFEIVALSLRVSSQAVLYAALSGIPLGAMLAISRFRGRHYIVGFLHAFMALPPVFAGLVVYLALSRASPLGFLGLLYTPAAMIAAQTIVIFPITLSLSIQLIEERYKHYQELFDSLCLSFLGRVRILMWECRGGLTVVCLAAFGRAISEVGAVLIVGGNIYGFTRVMTTTIALETSKGNLAFALALGIILLTISVTINLLVAFSRPILQGI